MRQMETSLDAKNAGMLFPNRNAQPILLDTIHPDKKEATLKRGRFRGDAADRPEDAEKWDYNAFRVHRRYYGTSAENNAQPSVRKLIRMLEKPQSVPAWLRDLFISPFTVHNYEVLDRDSNVIQRSGYRCFESVFEIPYNATAQHYYEYIISGPDRDAHGRFITLATRGASSFWLDGDRGKLKYIFIISMPCISPS
jgi:hypothetical protein